MKKLAQTGLQFLKVDMSPRAAAMGGAYNVAGYGAEAMFYNPAGMARMEHGFDFVAGQTQWIADITYNAIGVAKSFGNWGTFGFSFVFCDYGDIEGTIVADNPDGYEKTGNLDVGASAIGFSYARNLSDKFTIGAQIKYVSQNLGKNTLNDGSEVTNEVADLAYDFGTIFYPGLKSFRFGMSIRNFSRELKYEKEGFQLPLTFTLGVAMNVFDLWNVEDHSLLIAIDALHPRDYSERVHFGAEYCFMNMFSVRFGYKMNYDEENLTMGVGFQKNLGRLLLKVDYGYSAMDLFDSINRFSLGIGF
jgi:hypothetical protein